MKGSFEKSGTKYEWWAGPASPDADEDWCVHCRSGDWGVTRNTCRRSLLSKTPRSMRSS